MMISKLRENVLNNKNLCEEDFIIRGLWSTDCLFKPSNYERLFDYKFIVSQTIGQGCAYSLNRNYNENFLKNLIGKNYRSLSINDIALEISILDSIYDKLKRKPDYQVELNGVSIEKAETRAEIIVGETLNLITNHNLKNDRPLICNVGVVGNIIKQLLKHDVDVVGTDFDVEIVDKKLFDKVDIFHGDKTLDIVSKSDVAIVTGMTLATNTLDDIINIAKLSNTKLLIFAETGANFGSFYIDNGIDCVISEPYPFYIFQGKTNINVFKKQF